MEEENVHDCSHQKEKSRNQNRQIDLHIMKMEIVAYGRV